jgi:predicted permease
MLSASLIAKLVAILLAVAIGYAAGRMRWLGGAEVDPARVLGNAAFYVFVPALLFRTTARLPLDALPWPMLVAFFVPVLVVMFLVYAWQHLKLRHASLPVPAPAVRAISAVFGNTLQVGVPMASALFGEEGLGLHITITSLHALTLLTALTIAVEIDLARAQARGQAGTGTVRAHPLAQTLRVTVRNTVIHPVVLPVLLGLGWNAVGLSIPAGVDETLEMLGSAVVPLCLVLIGMSLAYYGLPKAPGEAVVIAVLKLLVLPAIVLVVARWGFGLHGLPLSVAVMVAALPTGSNAFIFAQRYDALQAEVTAVIVFSTLAYVATAPVWLAVLHWLG